MKKVETKKEKKLFTLKETFKKVESLGIVIKDIQVGKDKTGAVCFMTVKTDKGLIEAQMALEDNKDFLRHIVAMIDQIIDLEKNRKNEKGR